MAAAPARSLISVPVILKARGSQGAPGDGQATVCSRRRSLFTLWDSELRRPRPPGMEAEGGPGRGGRRERVPHPPSCSRVRVPGNWGGRVREPRNRSICCSEGPGVKGRTVPGRATSGGDRRRGTEPTLTCGGTPPRSLRKRPPLPIMGLNLESRISDWRLAARPAFQNEQVGHSPGQAGARSAGPCPERPECRVTYVDRAGSPRCSESSPSSPSP